MKAKTKQIFRCKLLISLILLFFAFSNAQAQHKVKVKENFPNGKTKLKGSYQQDKKVGLWFYYDPAGWILYKEKWRNGNLLWRIEYNAKHQKVKGTNAQGVEVIYKGCNCKN